MTNIPQRYFGRNEHGLVKDDSINYIYNEDGTIDWRKMIPSEFLVPNKMNFERRGKTIPTDISTLEDKDLLILLGGIKKLAQIRGYYSVDYVVTSSNENYVVAVCKIIWMPNYETNNISVSFSAIGDANLKNTNSFGKDYLGPIAENRAFVRAVRNFLKINIVSQEEIGGNCIPAESNNTSVSQLRNIMQKYGVTFEMIKGKLEIEKYPNIETINSIEDLPTVKQFELASRIKTKGEAATNT